MICTCGGKETVSIEQTFKDGSVHIRLNCAKCGLCHGFAPTVSDEDFVMPFGKHKGKRLVDLEKTYLEWLASDEFKGASGIKNRAARTLRALARQPLQS